MAAKGSVQWGRGVMTRGVLYFLLGIMLAPGAAISAQVTAPEMIPQKVADYALLSKQNAQWKYNVNWRIEERKLTSRKLRHETGTLTIVNEGETIFEGTRVTRVSWTFGGQIAYRVTHYLVASSDAVSQVGIEFMAGGTTRQERFQPPMVYLREPLTTGSTWESTGLRIKAGRKPDQYALNMSIVNREQISTPAGQFEVLKFVGKYESGTTSTEWWAKDIGLVRLEQSKPTQGLVAELVQYSIPTELPHSAKVESPPGRIPESPPLTNDDVVALAKAGLSDAAIVATILRSRTHFDLSPDKLLKLKQAGISNTVIEAMVGVRPARP